MPNDEAALDADDSVTLEAPVDGGAVGAPPSADSTSAGASKAAEADPAEPAPEPKAKDIAAALREKSQLRRARVLAQAEIDQFARAKGSELDAKAHALAQRESEIAARSAKVDQAMSLLERLPKEPEKALELLGIDPETFFRRVTNGGAVSVEEKVAILTQKLEQQARETSEREAAAKVAKEAAEREAHEAREARAISNFAAHIVTHPEDFKFTAIEFEQREVEAEASKIISWARSQRPPLAFDDQKIAAVIEEVAKSKYTARKERESKLAPRDRETQPEGSQQTGTSVTERRQATRTLTNKGSTQRAAAPKPMTDEEADAWALDELRKATAADSKVTR